MMDSAIVYLSIHLHLYYLDLYFQIIVILILHIPHVSLNTIMIIDTMRTPPPPRTPSPQFQLLNCCIADAEGFGSASRGVLRGVRAPRTLISDRSVALGGRGGVGVGSGWGRGGVGVG